MGGGGGCGGGGADDDDDGGEERKGPSVGEEGAPRLQASVGREIDGSSSATVAMTAGSRATERCTASRENMLCHRDAPSKPASSSQAWMLAEVAGCASLTATERQRG